MRLEYQTKTVEVATELKIKDFKLENPGANISVSLTKQEVIQLRDFLSLIIQRDFIR